MMLIQTIVNVRLVLESIILVGILMAQSVVLMILERITKPELLLLRWIMDILLVPVMMLAVTLERTVLMIPLAQLQVLLGMQMATQM
jgi:hypothetical protein